MEKETLTAFEKKCIQEEPAFCTAACPFHLDVRAFVLEMEKGQPDKAFKVLEKTLPLPEIMARVCDHPCEKACIRTQIDAPIALGKLERACATNRTKQKKYFPAPPKAPHIGIWGSGLSSLVAAWDLILKGYRISVFELASSLGGFLNQVATLDRSVLDQEIRRLERFGVTFNLQTAYTEFMDKREAFDAVYLGLDADGGPAAPPKIDPFSLQSLETPNCFAGGFSASGEMVDDGTYPVNFAFQGRKAATSMDRILSRVSLGAGREKEGPFQTGLSTDISRAVARPEIQFALETGYDIDKAAREAGRCLQCDCSRCLRVCNTYLEAFKGFPGKYARVIYNNAAIVMGDKKANLLINSCTLCDLCKTVCPKDFSMADLCLQARQEMVETGKMPPSAHEFALGEMAHALGEDCCFARHAPGEKRSDQVFFPGCQLTGSSPDQVKNVYEWLKATLKGSTGLFSACCGAPAFWAGDKDRVDKTSARLKDIWHSLGRPRIITACTSCTLMLETALPRAKISSLYQEMTRVEARLPARKKSRSDPAAVIDPCTARQDKEVRKAVRQLVQKAGVAIRELPAAGKHTECCGFGGLVFNANPELSKQIIENRAGQGSQDYIVYCAMCRDRLARTGKKTVHILDLFWPGTDHPELRKDPGFSTRRMNLAAFKHEMTGTQNLDRTRPRGLSLDPETRARIEDEFILISDIEKVLAEAHKDTGTGHFSNPEKDSLIAFFRPANVCFWVEFKVRGANYEILDAWCHRMQVDANKAFAPGTPGKETPEGDDEGILCAACNSPLGHYKNHVHYLGSRFDVVLPQCRGCGAVYVSPALSRGKMAEVEKILEDK